MALNKTKQKEVDDLCNRDIIDIVGLSKLEESKKQELRGKILEVVQNRVFERILQSLKEINKIDDFKKLDQEDAIESFFADNDIDTDGLFLEEALIYKAQLKTASDIMGFGFKPQVRES